VNGALFCGGGIEKVFGTALNSDWLMNQSSQFFSCRFFQSASKTPKNPIGGITVQNSCHEQMALPLDRGSYPRVI